MWTDRPCQVATEGDVAECSKWLQWARNKILALRQAGMPPFTQHDYSHADVKIHVKLGGPFDVIYVKTGGCPDFTSGLVDIQLPPKPSFGVVDILWDLADPLGNAYQAIKRVYPHTKDTSGNHYGPWGDNKILAGNYKLDDASKLNSMLFKTPGKFSGEMRKVVQVIIGLGKPVPYEYKFYRCHGIFRAADGTPWVIEVSSSRGVLAWKLPTCSQASKQPQTGLKKEVYDNLGYLPLSSEGPLSDLPGALTRGTARVLLPAYELQQFYQKESLFEGCGWAFSPNGHAAQNTCWEMRGDGYMQSYRYRIDIAETENAPVSATLSAVETGIVHGNRVSGLKVPTNESAAVPMIEFDLYYGKNPTYLDATGPLYVFYKSDGTEVVARMTPGQPSQSEHTQIATNFLDYAVMSLGNFRGLDGVSLMEPAPFVDGGHVNVRTMSGSYQSTSFNYRNDPGVYTPVSGRLPGFVHYLSDNCVVGNGTAYAVVNGSETTNVSLVIPWHDRESIYSAYITERSGTQTETFEYIECPFVKGVLIGAAEAGGSPSCGGSNSSWNYWSDPAPLVGTVQTLWNKPQFSKKIPAVPAPGDAFCDSAAPFVDSLYAATVDYELHSGKTFVEGGVRLITSGKDYDVAAESSGIFFSFTWGDNAHFMAVYRDAFAPDLEGKLYAYIQPDQDSPLYHEPGNYPDDVSGKHIPILFVGKP